jgi:hypothetical protein
MIALEIENPGFRPETVLDAGAGSGVWGRAAKAVFNPRIITGVDTRELPKPVEYTHWYQDDFLTAPLRPYQLILGNPPYKHAEAFIRRSLEVVDSVGYILFLLRLSFLEGQARAVGLWKEHPPVRVWISSRRISFTGNQKSDDTAYALYLWQPMYRGSTHLSWLNWEYEK